LLPEQTGGSDDTVPVGLSLTVMSTLAVFVQPFAPVPVTVYVVDVLGYARTTGPVAIDKSILGLQVYELAPLAVSNTLSPLQNVADGGVMVIVGNPRRVIDTSSLVAVHGGLEIVQRRTYVVPDTPVKVDVGLDGLANEPPAPLTMLHVPVPVTGVLPARVAVVAPQALV